MSHTPSFQQARLMLKLACTSSDACATLNTVIAPHDKMFEGNAKHYFNVGSSALNVIQAAMLLSQTTEIRSVLDYACGAGRVTRWLRAAFPDAEITAADIRSEDVEFCAQLFHARPWHATTNLHELESPQTYDLIWSGSLLTHLSEDGTRVMIERFVEWCRPGGLVVFTTHGRRALHNQKKEPNKYIGDDRFQKVEEDHRSKWFGYADYADSPGYGISLTHLNWINAFMDNRPDLTLVYSAERAWDNHQDVIAIQKKPV